MLFDNRRRLSVLGDNILLAPSVHIWVNLTGFSINGHADVAWLDCKQMQQCRQELTSVESFEVEYVDSVAFASFSVKKTLALSTVCVSESDEDSSTLHKARSLRLDFWRRFGSNVRLLIVSVRGSAHSGLKNATQAKCPAGSLIDGGLFKAQ